MKPEVRLPPWSRRALRWAAWPTFYIGALLLFARCTFPYERISERMIATYNASEAQGSGRRLEIDSMSGSWLFGVKARGVRLVSPAPPPGEDGKPIPAKVTSLDSVWGSVAPLRLLLGTVRASFGAQAGDGSASGSYLDSSQERHIVLDLDGMNVETIPLLTETLGVPLTGKASGKVDLTFPEKRLSLAEGSLELTIDDLAVGDGKTKIRDVAALPRIAAGKLELVAEANAGKLQITKLSGTGPDLEVSVTGQIRLKDSYQQSMAELVIRFKFADRYKTKNDITKGLFGEPGSAMPGLLDLDPKMKQAKQSDGAYSFSASGPLSRLVFSPGTSAAPDTTKSRTIRRRMPRRMDGVAAPTNEE